MDQKIHVLIVAIVAIVAIFSLIAQQKTVTMESVPQLIVNEDLSGQAVKVVRNTQKPSVATMLKSTVGSTPHPDINLLFTRRDTVASELSSMKLGMSTSEGNMRRILR